MAQGNTVYEETGGAKGCCLGYRHVRIITVVRAGLENKKWMMRLSFIQKRWIFFPLYLIAVLFFISNYGMLKPFGFREAIIYSIFFFIFATILTVIAEKKYKKDKRNLTDSVMEYKNKIEK